MKKAETTNRTDISQKITISFSEIIKYFGGFKRSIKAGEQLVNAGWVYSIGVVPQWNPNSVLGLVIQASSITSSPHEVKLENLTGPHKAWKCICSCKAGEGQKCKHVAACLIHIYRQPNLEQISCTQLKQKWGKAGRDFGKKYSAINASELCCARQTVLIKDDTISEEKLDDYLLELLNEDDGEIYKTFYGNRSKSRVNINNENQLEDFCKLMLCHCKLSKFASLMKPHLTPMVMSFYQNNVEKSFKDTVQIFNTTKSQCSAQWLTERRLRITGSVSYALFTYHSNKTPNWPKKIKSIYDSNFKGNNDTKYGQHAEKLAKQILNHHYLLFECGLMICPDLPFLAISPDAIAYDGVQWKLIEIKSPVIGRNLTANNVLKTLKYLKPNQVHYELNQQHGYFGQIQLGLAITNLNHCDLIIFSSYDKTYEIIKVYRDDVFLDRFIPKLCDIYFKYVIPHLSSTIRP